MIVIGLLLTLALLAGVLKVVDMPLDRRAISAKAYLVLQIYRNFQILYTTVSTMRSTASKAYISIHSQTGQLHTSTGIQDEEANTF